MSEAKQSKTSGRGADEKAISTAFGDIVSVLMRTEPFHALNLKDLEWLVMPALRTGQFALAHGDPRAPENRGDDADGANSKPLDVPIAVVLWAFVSDDVDARLRAAPPNDGILRLAPNEWRGGNTPWIIAAAGVPQALRAILGHMTTQVFQDAPANILVGDGKTQQVRKLLPPKEEAADAKGASTNGSA